MPGGDEELLKSGLFADTTLTCRNREWKLHKAILCTRSDWFRKALSGQFKEAKTGKITIQGQDPEVVNSMIHWLYTKEFPSMFHESLELYSVCTKLFKVADYLQMDDLKSEIKDHLDFHLNEKATMVQRQFCTKVPGNKRVFLSPNFFSDIHGGLKIAYELGHQGITGLYVQFVTQTLFWVLLEPQFQRLLEAVPEYRIDVYKRLLEEMTERPFFLGNAPKLCCKCKKSWPAGDDDWRWKKVWQEGGVTMGECEDCALKSS